MVVASPLSAVTTPPLVPKPLYWPVDLDLEILSPAPGSCRLRSRGKRCHLPEQTAPAADNRETGAHVSSWTTPLTREDLDVTVADIHAAAARIAAFVHRTPLIETETLSQLTQTRLGLKAENLQRTGSFKVRGALNAILKLDPEQRQRGVVTLSAGNHGQALAYAARSAGVRCVVFMPQDAVPVKVAAVQGYGGEAHFAPSMQALRSTMEAYRQDHGLHFVHPFGDPDVIAGQGTVGLEILADSPDVEMIVAPVGGGGLLAGLSIAARSANPNVRIVGVEPEGAAVVSQSLAARRPLSLERITTVADGLAAPFADPLTLQLIERNVDDVVILTDEAIVGALRLVLERTKLLVEPAGAAAVAAVIEGRGKVPIGSRAIAILSGGNVDFVKLRGIL